MQYLIAYTANRNGLVGGNWTTNKATPALRFSHKFGFGAIDAEAIVTRGRHWINVPEQLARNITPFESSKVIEANASLTLPFTVESDIVFLEHVVLAFNMTPEQLVRNVTPFESSKVIEADTSLTLPFTVESDIVSLEHVVLAFTMSPIQKYPERVRVTVDLISPLGTISHLLPLRLTGTYNDWPLMSVHFWGENPAGTWTIVINNTNIHGTIKVEVSKVSFYGTSIVPEAVSNIPKKCSPECGLRRGGAAISAVQQYPERGRVTVDLMSPSGTTSHLLLRLTDKLNDTYNDWPLMSVHFWGENPAGTWTIVINNTNIQGTIKVEVSNVTLYGTSKVPEAVSRIPEKCSPECDPTRGCAASGAEFCDACSELRVATTRMCISSCPVGLKQSHGYCYNESEPEKTCKAEKPTVQVKPRRVSQPRVKYGAIILLIAQVILLYKSETLSCLKLITILGMILCMYIISGFIPLLIGVILLLVRCYDTKKFHSVTTLSITLFLGAIATSVCLLYWNLFELIKAFLFLYLCKIFIYNYML